VDSHRPGDGEGQRILLRGTNESKAGYHQKEILARIATRRQQAHNTLLRFRQTAQQSEFTKEGIALGVIELLCDDLQADAASLTLAEVRQGRSYEFSRHGGRTTGALAGSLPGAATLPAHSCALAPAVSGVTASFRALLYRDGSREPYACLALFSLGNRSLGATEIALADEVAEWAAQYLTSTNRPGPNVR